MLISYNWIKEFIPKLTESPEEVAQKLSNSLAEVESVERVGDDFVLEIENKALSHRADLFGQLGLAREIAAIIGKEFVLPDTKKLDKVTGEARPATSIEITLPSPEISQRYCAAVITGVKVEESPKWLQERLISVGLRPISNIVDITNYLMFKYGQPLHAFDLDVLGGDPNNLHIEVRLAKEDEPLTLLDDSELTLTPKDIVIANVKDKESLPIALAGIMGGKSAQIRENTTNILLESANFNQFMIRASSRRHSIRSEASLRFEKGIGPEIAMPTILEAIEMITGDVNADLVADKYNPLQREPTQIKINASTVNYYLNTNQSKEQIKKVLNRLEITAKELNDDELILTIPSHRKDLRIKEDIYEELGRIYDYNKIEPTLPTRNLKPNQDNPMWRLKNEVRDILTRAGVDEVISYSFITEEQAGLYSSISDNKLTLKRLSDINSLHLKNTLSPELSYMRSSLIPSITNVIIENAKRFDEFDVFEIGPVTIPQENDLPDEPQLLTIASFKRSKNANDALIRVKSLWKRLVKDLVLPKQYAKVLPLQLNLHDTKGYGFVYEIDLRQVLKERGVKKYDRIALSPPTKQDISFFIPATQEVGPIVDLVYELAGANIKEVELLDIYQSEEMRKSNKKSITLRMIFEDVERSIPDSEINPIREKIESELIAKFNAQIR